MTNEEGDINGDSDNVDFMLENPDWNGEDEIKGEPFIDEDRMYEDWVMRQIDRLDDDLRVLFDSYVKGNKSKYYKGCPDKFIQHAITTLESLKGVKK